MQKQHKDLLRTVVTALRHRLAGTWDAAGALSAAIWTGNWSGWASTPTATSRPSARWCSPRTWSAALPGQPMPASRPSPPAPPLPGRRVCQRRLHLDQPPARPAHDGRELIDETLRPNPPTTASEALFLLRHNAPAPRGRTAAGRPCSTLPAARDAAAPRPLRPGRPQPPACAHCAGAAELPRYLGGQLPGATHPVETVDAVFRDPDVLGWAYQFYQQEAKDRVYAKLGQRRDRDSQRDRRRHGYREPTWSSGCCKQPGLHLPRGVSWGRSYTGTWEYYIREDREIGDQEDWRLVEPPRHPQSQSLSSFTLLD